VTDEIKRAADPVGRHRNITGNVALSGVVRQGSRVTVVDAIAENGDDVVVHDAPNPDAGSGFTLSRLTDAGQLGRTPLSIFRSAEESTYDDQARQQAAPAQVNTDRDEALADLLAGGTWNLA
jgi:hypothetical protein